MHHAEFAISQTNIGFVINYIETTRRNFARLSGAAVIAGLLPGRLLNAAEGVAPGRNSNLIFLEAEQFADTGGWDTDRQSICRSELRKPEDSFELVHARDDAAVSRQRQGRSVLCCQAIRIPEQPTELA